jgi:hypothetical protein
VQEHAGVRATALRVFRLLAGRADPRLPRLSCAPGAAQGGGGRLLRRPAQGIPRQQVAQDQVCALRCG